MKTRKYSRHRPALIKYLREHSKNFYTLRELAKEIGCSEVYMRVLLDELAYKGIVAKSGKKMPVAFREGDSKHGYSYHYIYTYRKIGT